VSVGPSPQLFRLGGVDRLRGFSRNDPANSAPRYVMTNLEWRFPIKYMNYYTWFIFPDFYFKAIYGALFTDAGYAWDRSSDLETLKADRVRNSAGLGVRMPVFVLQTFLATVALDVAKRTDTNNWVWYVSLGPEF
jgi:outer membrane protein assembly factor BamA